MNDMMNPGEMSDEEWAELTPREQDQYVEDMRQQAYDDMSPGERLAFEREQGS